MTNTKPPVMAAWIVTAGEAIQPKAPPSMVRTFTTSDLIQSSSPCEPGCEFSERCKHEDESCGAFGVYLATGARVIRSEDDTPTAEHYREQFLADPLLDGRNAEAKQAKRKKLNAEVSQ